MKRKEFPESEGWIEARVTHLPLPGRAGKREAAMMIGGVFGLTSREIEHLEIGRCRMGKRVSTITFKYPRTT